MEEDITKYDFEKPKNGPNLLHFTHWYFGAGVIVQNPYEKSIDIENVSTHNLIIGYRYKLRVTNWLAFGADGIFYSESYYFKDNFFKESLTETSTNHNTEKIRLNNAGAEIYMRLNFGKRGNVIGKFVDFAAYGLYIFDAKHIYIDKLQTPGFYHAKKIKVENRQLTYIESLNYGVKLRCGYNRYAVFFIYRFSDILSSGFKTDNNLYELPRFSFGFQIGLH